MTSETWTQVTGSSNLACPDKSSEPAKAGKGEDLAQGGQVHSGPLATDLDICRHHGIAPSRMSPFMIRPSTVLLTTIGRDRSLSPPTHHGLDLEKIFQAETTPLPAVTRLLVSAEGAFMSVDAPLRWTIPVRIRRATRRARSPSPELT